jgi:hypothetical protein
MGKRWGVFNGKEVSAFRVYGGTKCGTLGSVAEGGRTDLDWANVGQALFVYFQSSKAVRWYSSTSEMPFQAGTHAG